MAKHCRVALPQFPTPEDTDPTQVLCPRPHTSLGAISPHHPFLQEEQLGPES